MTQSSSRTFDRVADLAVVVALLSVYFADRSPSPIWKLLLVGVAVVAFAGHVWKSAERRRQDAPQPQIAKQLAAAGPLVPVYVPPDTAAYLEWWSQNRDVIQGSYARRFATQAEALKLVRTEHQWNLWEEQLAEGVRIYHVSKDGSGRMVITSTKPQQHKAPRPTVKGGELWPVVSRELVH